MHTDISRALIIDAPWIDHILAGRKIWEMRSRPTKVRGSFGLIRKGSGQLVGVANLVDCRARLSAAELAATEDMHRIPPERQPAAHEAGWTVPWVLADVVKLAVPVPYDHPHGAVTWVLLTDETKAALRTALGAVAPPAVQDVSSDDAGAPKIPSRIVVKATLTGIGGNGSVKAKRASPAAGAAAEPKAPGLMSRMFAMFGGDAGMPKASSGSASAPASVQAVPEAPAEMPVRIDSTPSGELIGDVILTEGNIRNSHFYLRGLIDKLPRIAIGGSNKAGAARSSVIIEWPYGEPIETDIDGSKMIFRKRGWIGRLFQESNARPGDRVRLHRVGENRIRVQITRS